MKLLMKDLKNVFAVSYKFVTEHWFALAIFNMIIGAINYIVLFTNIPEHIAKFIKSLLKKSHE